MLELVIKSTRTRARGRQGTRICEGVLKWGRKDSARECASRKLTGVSWGVLSGVSLGDDMMGLRVC